MPVKLSLLCQAGRRRQCLRMVLCYLRSCGDDGRDDGERALPLERVKLGEQDAHLARRVLVDPVKPDERIKHEEARPMLVERPPEPSKVALGVETEARHDDEAHVDRGERYVARRTDGVETFIVES